MNCTHVGEECKHHKDGVEDGGDDTMCPRVHLSRPRRGGEGGGGGGGESAERTDGCWFYSSKEMRELQGLKRPKEEEEIKEWVGGATFRS